MQNSLQKKSCNETKAFHTIVLLPQRYDIPIWCLIQNAWLVLDTLTKRRFTIISNGVEIIVRDKSKDDFIKQKQITAKKRNANVTSKKKFTYLMRV